MDACAAVIDNSAPDADGSAANYKGVALSAELGSGLLLYAANVSQNRIDVFDGAWQQWKARASFRKRRAAATPPTTRPGA